MRFSLPLFVASILYTVDAFFPVSQQRTMPSMTSTAQQMAEEKIGVDVGLGEVFLTYEPKPDPPKPSEVIQGVHLPDGMVPKRIDNAYVNGLIRNLFAPSMLMNVNGYLKSNPFQAKKGPLTVIHEIMTNVNEYKAGFAGLIQEDPKLAKFPFDKYKFFGNGNHIKSLAELLKNNPFFTSALVASADGGFELNAYNPDGASTRFQKMIATLTSPGRKVNIKFDKDMNFVSYEVFDDQYPSLILAGGDVPDEEANKWASSAMYNMLFYSSCQHVVIHVLHYLLTSAFQYVATEHDKKTDETSGMKAWADTYANNIQDKYIQVGQLLIADTAPIPATAAANPSAAAGVIGGTFAIVTGPMGFGSSQALRPLLDEMLIGWGQNPTAKGWIDFMFQDVATSSEGIINPAADGSGKVLLEEFWKHYNVIPRFAHDMTRALKHESHSHEAEEGLCEYLNDLCGNFNAEFKGFENWIEVMCVTGQVHGCTLSYTRAIADWEVLRWRNIEDPYWDTGDMNILFGGMGTIVGMQLERHVMGGGQFLPKGKNESVQKLRHTLEKFDKEVTDLKKEYVMKLIGKAVDSEEETAEFLDYGWIWTDFCPDGIDGKQATMATYI